MGPSSYNNLPRHLAIIMDGNGRWAKSRGLPRVAGHTKGADSVRRIVTSCRKRGIEVLTLYAFSSQNWSRPKAEVSALFSLLSNYIKKETKTIMDNDIRLTAIGEINLLPDSPKRALENLISQSSNNKSMTLCLALSYGGREEIVDMVRSLSKRVKEGVLDLDQIDAELVDNTIWSSELGPVDLLVRTSGELRISNFLLWSSAYAEFFFTDKMWPDFDEQTLDEALAAYSSRNRRFGSLRNP